MKTSDALRYSRIPLSHESGAMPAVGFGTLIPDLVATNEAAKTSLGVGFRHPDCAERYGNEEAVGAAAREAFEVGILQREDLFVTTKLWNTNHRPERVRPAFDASRRRFHVSYGDCYSTPCAFHPGDDQHPRDDSGQVMYDTGVTLEDPWAALERLVDEGDCRAIGLRTSLWGSRARSSRRR